MGKNSAYATELRLKYSKLCETSKYSNPIVSIIVPAYNVANYIERCLLSLVQQSFKNIEIIVIDDGSEDMTSEIIDTFGSMDSRLVVIHQQNRGVSAARNKGIEISKGEYIAFVDSDDYVDENFIFNLHEAITKYDCDISAATIIRKRSKSQKYRVHYTKEKVYKTLEEKIKCCDIPRCCYVFGKLFKAELIKDKYFEEGVYFEDILWLPEVIKQANTLVTIPGSTYWYRVNQNSIVKKNSPLKQYDSYNAKKYIVDFFNENNLKLSKKNQHPTKDVKYLFSIPIVRIKDYGKEDKYFLFDIFPVKTRKNSTNLKYKKIKKFFFFKNIDAHFYIELFKTIKLSLKNNFKFNYKEAKGYSLTNEKRTPQLIVSLTSFPARIPTIDKTINTLLNQTIKPDRLILWLAEEQFPNKEGDLTQELLNLKEKGLEIRWCEDLRSYKKLVPALREFPEDIIVTADDDLYYQQDWLESLYNEYLQNPNYIYIRRACRIKLKNNVFSVNPSYAKSDFKPTFLNQLLGGAGALYPPHSLHEDIFNVEQIKTLIPTHDDIYFWIMAVLKGTKIKLVKIKDASLYTVEDTQRYGLCKVNNALSIGMSPATATERILEKYPQAYELIERESIKNVYSICNNASI